MAVQARVNLLAQQRLDLTHVLSAESFTAFDFRALMTFFTGSTSAYILRGFQVTGKSGLTISINQADAVVANPQDNNGSFYRGLPSDPDAILTLPANQTNIFVEATFQNVTQAPVSAAFWNPLSLTGSDVAGDEFSASTDSQVVLQLVITSNTTGFTPGSMWLFKLTTDSSSVTNLEDARNLMFRLGKGGVTPNPAYRFPWSVNRMDSVISGSGVDEESNSSFLRQDGTGILNDKGIYNFKDWMDAVMTRFIEITGSSLWFSSGAANVPVTGLSLASAFFDSDNGSYINPSATNALIWDKNTTSGALTLQSNGTAISAGRGTVAWQYNYGSIQWELGGTFVNNVPGGTRTYQIPTFTSPAPVDGGNIYLFLERETPKGSGNAVQWASVAADPIHLTNPSQDVSGQAGDFVGIAIGDYIRKISEGYSRYSQVTKMVDGLGNVYTTVGYVADSTISGLELADPILSGPSSEPLIYFRSRYSNADLYADQVVGQYNYRDIDYTWIGRRVGQNFILKNHGTIQPGEKFKIEDSSSINGVTTGDGSGGLMLKHAPQTSFTTATGYQLQTGSGTILTIRRRKRDNTIPSPGPLNTNNDNGYLTYTLASPVGTLNVGDSLWVKLDDNNSGALTAGNVTDPTDAAQDTNTVTNVYQVLTSTQTPLRTYNNRDVYLVARCIATNVLQFADGTLINSFGQELDANVEITQNLKVDGALSIGSLVANSIVYTNASDVLTTNPTLLGFNDVTQQARILNYLFGQNTLEQVTPGDMTWFSTIGAHTLNMMAPGSTLHIKGGLIVDGPFTPTTSTAVAIDNKTITLGVGNPLNGGAGDGINVADNTLQATQYAATNGSAIITVTYAAAHGYGLGNMIGAEASEPVGGITASQINATYTVVTTASAPGQAQVLSATTMAFYSSGTATSAQTIVCTPPSPQFRTYLTPSSIYLTAADGSATAITSWAFTVKGKNPVTITPVTGYTVVPTLNASEATAGRLMFSGVNASGPGAITTTIDEDANLFWDNTNKRLGVGTSSPGWTVDIHGITAIGDGAGTEIFLRAQSGFNTLGAWHLSVRGDVGGANDDFKLFRFVGNAAQDIPFQVSNATGKIYMGSGQPYSTVPTYTSLVNIGVNSTTPAGGLTFGTDTNLYRLAAATLATDGTLNVGTALALRDSTTNTVSIKAATTTVSYNIVLPSAQGLANSVPYNDGAGNLTWHNTADVTTGVAQAEVLIRANSAGLLDNSWVNYAIQFPQVGIGAAPSTALLQIGTNTTTPAGGIQLGTDTMIYRVGVNQLQLSPTQTTQLAVGTTLSGTQVLSIGTNTTTAAGGALWGTGLSNIYRSAADTLKTDGNFIVAGSFSSTSFTIAGLTQGSVLFAGASGMVTQDNAQIFWDDTNFRLALGTNTPVTGAALTISRSNTDYTNTNGADAHLALVNPLSNGMTSISFVTNGNSMGKIRADFAGNLSYATFAGAHNWFTNGDSGVGALQMALTNAGQLQLGTNTTTSAFGMVFGTDTNLYRSAAASLKTNGTFALGTSLLMNGSTSGTLTLSVPVTVTSYSLTLPAAQGGNGTTLVNNGAGILSWATPLSGGMYVAYGSTKITTYAILTTDTVVPCDTTAGAFTITLPTSVAGNKGQVVIVKDVGGQVGVIGKALTIAPNGTDTIDGSNTSIIMNFAPNTALTFIANGAGGWILT